MIVHSDQALTSRRVKCDSECISAAIHIRVSAAGMGRDCSVRVTCSSPGKWTYGRFSEAIERQAQGTATEPSLLWVRMSRVGSLRVAVI